MKTYNIYKKRDGQSWKMISYIYAADFETAQKEFAKMMTEDNHNLCNDINWFSKGEVDVPGWYLEGELFVSEEDIEKGFDSWSEDVYSWELRDSFEVEVWLDNEFLETVIVESLEQANNIYPSGDGYTIKEIK